jgi:hypothetical protein
MICYFGGFFSDLSLTSLRVLVSVTDLCALEENARPSQNRKIQAELEFWFNRRRENASKLLGIQKMCGTPAVISQKGIKNAKCKS